MNAALNVIAGCCGIIGGFLWFFAASNTPTPPTAAYYDVVDSPTSPFAKAWRSGTRFKANKPPTGQCLARQRQRLPIADPPQRSTAAANPNPAAVEIVAFAPRKSSLIALSRNQDHEHRPKAATSVRRGCAALAIASATPQPGSSV